MSRHRWEPRCTPPRGLAVPVRPGRADDGPTHGQVRGRSWRRTSRGLYVPAGTPTEVPEQRILEAAARLPPLGCVTGWGSLRVLGSTFHDGLEPDGRTPIPVPLALGWRGRVTRDPGISLGFEALNPSDWIVVRGIPVMRAVRATFDAMRRTGDVRDAVVELEKSVMAELHSIEDLAAFAASRRGARRIGVVREAVPLASEHSRSPREPRLRLVAVLDAGFPRDLRVNCFVQDLHGRVLGEVDLLDEEAGLVLEFDGADHRDARRQSRDAVKTDDLRDVGLEVMRVTGSQLRDVPTLVRRLQAARSRASFTPPHERRWVPVPRQDTLHRRLRQQRELGALLENHRGDAEA